MIGFDVFPDLTEFAWGLFSAGFQVLFWGVLIVVAVKAVQKQPSAPSPSALSVLEERYARGEIDRDEFLQRKAVLQGRTR